MWPLKPCKYCQVVGKLIFFSQLRVLEAWLYLYLYSTFTNTQMPSLNWPDGAMVARQIPARMESPEGWAFKSPSGHYFLSSITTGHYFCQFARSICLSHSLVHGNLDCGTWSSTPLYYHPNEPNTMALPDELSSCTKDFSSINSR